jgi:hypothetical protein
MLQACRNPNEVIGFFTWPVSSSRNLVVGSTQPLTEMSTRNLAVVTGGWRIRLTTSMPSISRLSRKFGILDVLETYEPPRLVSGMHYECICMYVCMYVCKRGVPQPAPAPRPLLIYCASPVINPLLIMLDVIYGGVIKVVSWIAFLHFPHVIIVMTLLIRRAQVSVSLSLRSPQLEHYSLFGMWKKYTVLIT